MDRDVICEKAITVCLVVILVLLAVIFVVKFLQRQNNENEKKYTDVIGLQVNWTLKNTEENEEKTGEIIMQDLDDSNDEREAIIKNTQLKEVMEIKLTDDSHEVIFTLNNSSAAKSLYNQLPLEVEVNDYSTNEKIFYPEEGLDTSDVVEGHGPFGSLAYFSPWGNVVMYYSECGPYSGLYLLGKATEGAENIEKIQ